MEEFLRALADPSAPVPPGVPHGTWGVFLLFVIPTGLGIPAGALLGSHGGLSILTMSALYFASGLVRALVFEPIVQLVGRTGGALKLSETLLVGLDRLGVRWRRRGGRWGGIFTVAYGVDPMAGRVVGAILGLGVLGTWGVSLAADMVYFVTTAVPTLWIDWVVGDQRTAIGLVMLLMIVGPGLWRRWRGRRAARVAAETAAGT